jgi:hypothetical protein
VGELPAALQQRRVHESASELVDRINRRTLKAARENHRRGAQQRALIEQIAGTLEEEHAEDEFLVLAGVHVAAQIVAGIPQQSRQAAAAVSSKVPASSVLLGSLNGRFKKPS